MRYFSAFVAVVLGIQALFADDQYPGYTLLQWIQSDRNQYIDTGVKVENKFLITAEIQLLSTELPKQAVFGGANNDNLNVCAAAVSTRNSDDGSTYYLRCHGSKYASATTGRILVDWAKHKHLGQRASWQFNQSSDSVTGSNIFRFNGYAPGNTASKFTRTATTSTNNIYICWASGPTGGSKTFAPAAIVLYSFNIKSGDTFIRKMIPAMRDSDGMIGMIDTVENVFYPNLGSKPFIAGPRVSPIYPSTDDVKVGYRAELTVSGYSGGSAVQKGLPVLVRISPSRIADFSYDNCLEDGADIFFATDSEGKNRLACDIDTWNTSGESLVWVKLPEVTGTDTKFYMFWGANEAAKRPSSTEVWSEYIAVWHMNECDVVTGVKDETGHGFNATNSTTNVSTPIESPSGRGLNLSHGLFAPNYDSYMTEVNNVLPDVLSISCWFKKPEGSGAENVLSKYSTAKNRIGFLIETTNLTTINDYTANSRPDGAFSSSSTSLADRSQNWLHHVFVSTGTNNFSFVDGVQKIKKNCTAGSDAIGRFNAPLKFGAGATPILMDEVRITRVPRNASWVKAEYETVTNPDFVVAGAAVSIQAAVYVSGQPIEYAMNEVSYGIDIDVSIGTPKTYTAPEFFSVDSKNRAVCVGWQLYSLDPTTKELVLTRTSENPLEGENATTCIVSPTGSDSLIWQWKDECVVDVEFDDQQGSVSGGGWCEKGVDATITAVPAEGYYFYCWSGDVTGVEDIYSPTLLLPVDCPKSISAVFRPTTDKVFEVTESGSVDFFDPSNWLNGNVPNSDGSSVVIIRRPPADVSVTVTTENPINIASLDLGFGSGKGSITFEFGSGLATNFVTGNVILREGSKLTHKCHPNTSNAKEYALNLEVGGNMIIDEGASVDATAKGYYFNKGPMPSDGSNYQGAGHGGTSQGGYNTDTYRVSANKCYGSIRRPDQPGGGGGTTNGTKNYGGGVIHLIVKNGTLTVNGSIGANGGNTDHSSPAGGSVWIECGTLAGTGSIDAYSGRATYSNGGGGRIAIRQYMANDISSFSGLIRAGRNPVTSSSYNGVHSVGSIYIENANDAEDRGELIVAGYDYMSSTAGMACRLDSTIDDIAVPFGKVSVKNNARLEIPSQVTLKVEKGISVTGNGDFHTVANGGAIEMMPGEDGSFVVEGLVKAYEIYCTNSPGATISFAQGAELRNLENGTIKLLGTEEKSLSLVPATQDGQWTMNVVAPDESKTFLQYLAVSNSVVDVGASVTAFNSIDLGGNLNWGFLSNVLPEGTLFVWTGVQNTNWETPGNWDQRIAPRPGDHVKIPSGSSNYPVVNANVYLSSITNESGASITLNGADLFVSNALYSAGTIIDNGQRIVVNGEGDTIFDLESGVAAQVYVEKNSGKVIFPHGFNAEKFYSVVPSSIEFVFGGGEEFSFNECNIESRGEDSHILRSTQSGNQWKLLLTENHRIYNVKVSDSNASKGEEITVSSVSTDAGNNTNWVFVNNIAEWIANGNGNWSNPANWSTGIVPSENDDVFIAPPSGTVTVTADVAVNVKSLTLGGTDAVLTFKSTHPVTISGDFTLLDDTTATLSSKNTPNTIGGNVLMKSGSKMNHADNTETYAYRLYVVVGGNMTIEEGASIPLSGLGFDTYYGPIDNQKNEGGNSNGGGHGSTIRYNSKYVPCNDSIFEPILPGTGGASGGAGTVYLDIAGNLIVNGEINAASHRGTNSSGAGGSICLKVGTLMGTGKITAATATSTKKNSWKGGAGRIAIYQRIATDWSASEHVRVTTKNSTPDGSHGGTIYKELPQDGNHGGIIYIEGRETIYTDYGLGFTQLPMAADGDPRVAYKKATLVIGSGAYVRMINDGSSFGDGAIMKVKDIIFESSDSYFDFYNTKIRVMSLSHNDGKGWTGGDYASRVSSGKINTGGELGGIEWYRGGFSIRVK